MASSTSAPNVCSLPPVSKDDLENIKELGKDYIKRFGKHTAREVLSAKDPHGITLLHYAAVGGETPKCKYLVETIKLDVNIRDMLGYTPLHYSVLEGHFMTSNYLLGHGALPNLGGNDGLTPLHCAAEQGRKDQLRLLISKGADVNALSKRKGTPLQCAAGVGSKDSVKILLEHKADPNANTHSLFTPLTAAIMSKSVDCVRLLLKSRADPNFCLHIEKPVVLAVTEKQVEITKCLLKAGADPNTTNYYDLTPIELAAEKGNVALVNLLFKATARLPRVPNWSCQGIFDYVHSPKTRAQWNLKVEPNFLQAKENGVKAYKNEQYFNAIFWYTEAVKIKPRDAAMYSNRSLCYGRLNDGENALKDASFCIELNPTWFKGYYRAGAAWIIMRVYHKAAEAFKTGLELEPNNKELRDAYKEAEVLRASRMGGCSRYCAGCGQHDM